MMNNLDLRSTHGNISSTKTHKVDSDRIHATYSPKDQVVATGDVIGRKEPGQKGGTRLANGLFILSFRQFLRTHQKKSFLVSFGSAEMGINPDHEGPASNSTSGIPVPLT